MKGKLTVLEGMDGSGTTTQASLLVKYLFEKDKANNILLTREPTKHSPYGKELRRRLAGELLEGEEVIDDADYWADLFINDRKWHLDNFVLPALDKGQQVISDRHKLSTIAYQSAQGGDIDELIRKHEGLYVPDLTLLLDLSAEMCINRMAAMRGKQEYFEHLNLQERIREQYLEAVEKLSKAENIAVLDGSKPIGEVAEEIRREIDLLYGYGPKS